MRKSVILSYVLSTVFLFWCPVTVVFAEDDADNVSTEQTVETKSTETSDETASKPDAPPNKATSGNDSQAQTPSNSTARDTKAVTKPLVIDGLVLTDAERRVFELTNLERQKRGLPALRLERRLMESARRQANWMARTGNFRHGNAPVAENIAMGQRSGREAVVSWLNSSGHFRNMMNRRHGAIGVGSFRGKNGVLYWCQQFTR